jgi:hypothetical protein
VKKWEGREKEDVKGRNGKGGKKEEVKHASAGSSQTTEELRKRGGAKGRRGRKGGTHFQFIASANTLLRVNEQPSSRSSL